MSVSYHIRNALTLKYTCVYGQICSYYFLQAKLGHHIVKAVGKGFELNIYRLKVHVCMLDSFCSGKGNVESSQ